jgi:hypothetical protein
MGNNGDYVIVAFWEMEGSMAAPLRLSENEGVLEYLDALSAHSNISNALMQAVKPLGDVELHCPNWDQYRCVYVSTNGLIFGLAVGMSLIGFRLNPEFKERALATGAEAFEIVGQEWAKFILFRPDWPQVDLDFWALKAYCFVRDAK